MSAETRPNAGLSERDRVAQAIAEREAARSRAAMKRAVSIELAWRRERDNAGAGNAAVAGGAMNRSPARDASAAGQDREDGA